MEDQGPSNAYRHMDVLRFVLASAVAFGHAWALFIEDYRPSQNLLVNGLYFAAGFAHASVILFFVLSGYWITRSVVTRYEAGWSWRSYLIDRLSRLLVVLIPALVLGGVLDAVALYWIETPTHLGMTETWVLNTDVSANLRPAVLLGNLFFLQGTLVAPFGTNGPLWSVAYEFWYYVWFPALLLTWRARRPSPALAVLLLGLITPDLALGFVSWLCGTALHFAEARLRKISHLPMLRGSRPLVASGLLFAVVLLWGRTGNFGIEDPILALSFALFLLTLLLTNPPLLRGTSGLAVYGARASFSLYATHFPLMAFAAGIVVGAQRLAPTPDGIAIALAALAAAVVAAYIFSRLTEARTGTLRHRLRRLLR